MLLQIQNLSFSYEPNRPLFQDFNWQFKKGEMIAIAGESGCGKSTLLSLIYGLWDWQEGDIIFDGQPIFGPKANIVPGEKDMKLVAQHFDLMPYGTVYDNVGQFISNINLQQKKEKVQSLLEIVGMEAFAKAQPKFLSGGQQQRVAIARALSVTPKLLLLDEPFSNLDVSRTMRLRERLFSYAKKEGLTVLISTHNLPEVMPWLDKILILKDGSIVQYDTPERVYYQPKNEYVARLFGEVNVLDTASQQELNLSRAFYYPNQIKLAKDGLEAEVIESLFSGGFYWNRIKIKNTTLIMYSERYLEGGINVTID